MPVLKEKIFLFIKSYERHLGVAALFAGFLFDSLTLSRPDQLFGNIVLGFYLFFSATFILYLARTSKRQETTPTFLLIILQFCFGNLAGGLTVLYGQSGTFEGNALFFLTFGAFLIGNEFLRSRYSRLNFQISAWFFLLLAYLALIVPVYLKVADVRAFLISGGISFCLLFFVLLLLYVVSPTSFAGMKRKTLFSIGVVFALFNAFYFLNIIPPVPLSLQHIGIYHAVTKTKEGDYVVSFEEPSRYEFFRKTSNTFHIVPDKAAYCFSSVFSPAGLSTPIRHRWERYNEGTETWDTSTLLLFSINGGREDGYRGYSIKYGLTPGTWRCSVETERGALIGRTTFEATPVDAPVLVQGVL